MFGERFFLGFLGTEPFVRPRSGSVLFSILFPTSDSPAALSDSSPPFNRSALTASNTPRDDADCDERSPDAPGRPFYEPLNTVLTKAGFNDDIMPQVL
jgi:hypothetical protein